MLSMILPVVPYGNSILRKIGSDITDFSAISELIDNMWQTMYNSNGIGLAAPQINQSIRLFVIDTTQIQDYTDGIKQPFINARILESSQETCKELEGCLSIPYVRDWVIRPISITIEYLDENLVQQTKQFTGLNARVIQHEYDHIEGKLFIDKLPQLSKRLIKKSLEDILEGKVNTKYPLLRK
jgi:peptide deformylase